MLRVESLRLRSGGFLLLAGQHKTLIVKNCETENPGTKKKTCGIVKLFLLMTSEQLLKPETKNLVSPILINSMGDLGLLSGNQITASIGGMCRGTGYISI